MVSQAELILRVITLWFPFLSQFFRDSMGLFKMITINILKVGGWQKFDFIDGTNIVVNIVKIVWDQSHFQFPSEQLNERSYSANHNLLPDMPHVSTACFSLHFLKLLNVSWCQIMPPFAKLTYPYAFLCYKWVLKLINMWPC